VEIAFSTYQVLFSKHKFRMKKNQLLQKSGEKKIHRAQNQAQNGD